MIYMQKPPGAGGAEKVKKMKIIKLAAAKLNLLLDLTGVFPNGYHGIYTVMQSVDLADVVSIEQAKDIALTCDAPEIPCDVHNTAYKAARLFFAQTGIEGGAHIDIQKRIPSQAGMAGGSADAAAVLCGLNELYQADLSRAQLCALGAKIGADVPFCIIGGTALCQNIGELCTKLPDLPACNIVCVKPDCNVSTAEAYAAYDALQQVRHPAKENAIFAYMQGDLQEFYRLCANVFEQAVDVPGRAEIKSVMRAFRCDFTLMTGSGSVVYGIFSDEKVAEDCASALRRGGRNAFVVHPVAAGILPYVK